MKRSSRQRNAREFLRNAHWGRARALDRLGRHAEAAPDWQWALELDDRKTALLHLGRAAHQARTGKHQEAVAAAEAFAGGGGGKADVLHASARVFAFASVAARDDTALRERYAARAVALLRQAHAAGYFKDAARAAALKRDADWKPLAAREGFRKLLAELEGK